MNSGLYFPTCAIFINGLVCVLFFFRKHLNTTETKIYSWLIMTNLAGLILEFLCTVASVIYGDFAIIGDIILKLYLVYIITWATIFGVYVYVISNNRDFLLRTHKTSTMIITTIYWIVVPIIMLLPIELIIKDDFAIRYTVGASVYFTYFISTLIIIFMLICMIKNYKHLKSKKYLPLFTFLVIGTGAMIFQMFYPGLILITTIESFIILLMYFTIENPDMRMVEELVKSRSVVDTANENKLMFVYNIVQNLRTPVANVKTIINEIIDDSNIEIVKRGLRDVSLENNRMSVIINNMLDISNVNSEKIKVYKTEYNLQRIVAELKIKYRDKITNNVQFIVNISDDIPEALYGDDVRLKQILNSILDNSLKYTKKGFIEMSASSIIKRDVCRLLITIEDSGSGMPFEQSGNIFNDADDQKITVDKTEQMNADLPAVKKIVDSIGGTILLESEKNRGTKVTIVLDQVIPILKKDTKYQSTVVNHKSVLIIDKYSKDLREKTIKVFSDKNIKVEYLEFAVTALERIKVKNSIDLIVINDNIEGTTCSEAITKIVQEEGYKGKIIVIAPNTKIDFYKHLKVYSVIDNNKSISDIEDTIIRNV